MIRITTAAVLALVAASANAQDGNAPNLTPDWPRKGNCPSTSISRDDYVSKYMCADNAACRKLDPTSCCVLYSFGFCGFPGTLHGGEEKTQCNKYNACLPDGPEPMGAEPPSLPESAEEFVAQLQALIDCQYDPTTEEFKTCLAEIFAKNSKATTMDATTSASAARETVAAVAAVVAGAALLG